MTKQQRACLIIRKAMKQEGFQAYTDNEQLKLTFRDLCQLTEQELKNISERTFIHYGFCYSVSAEKIYAYIGG